MKYGFGPVRVKNVEKKDDFGQLRDFRLPGGKLIYPTYQIASPWKLLELQNLLETDGFPPDIREFISRDSDGFFWFKLKANYSMIRVYENIEIFGIFQKVPHFQAQHWLGFRWI